ACKQLGLRRADNTVEAITALLTSSTDVDVQVSAAAALGEIAEVRSTSPLLKVLNTNPSPRLQYASLAALGGIARINGTGKHKAAVIEAATRVKSGSTDSLLQDLADKIIQMYQK
ncbi:MAG TPA: HEAT repeat domain-containing protein, partial [Leptospiraceae bacterium]|nr:HEAT repeat domain-containing protein [Leptospiraceae bacterium]